MPTLLNLCYIVLLTHYKYGNIFWPAFFLERPAYILQSALVNLRQVFKLL